MLLVLSKSKQNKHLLQPLLQNNNLDDLVTKS